MLQILHQSDLNQLQSVFKFARSEAAKRDKTVTLDEKDGEWHVMIDGQVAALQKFQPSHESISVDNLKDVVIAATGEIQGNDNDFLITDSDNSTVDFCLQILISGQVQRTKANRC